MKIKDVIVLIADGEEDRNGKNYSIDNVILPREPVLLTVDFNRTKIIGSARVKKCGDRLLAELFLFTASAIADTAILMDRVPAAGGILRGGKLEITEVSICMDNADARVPKFSHYIARKEFQQHAAQ